MSKYVVEDTSLTSIANAIRAKSGKSEQLEFPTEFVSEISNLTAGYTFVDIAEHAYIDLNPVINTTRMFPYSFYRAPFKTVTSNVVYFTDTASPTSTGMGSYVFARCTDLEEVSMPELAQPGSGGYQFAYCTKLKSIHLPKATFIGQNMFNGCSSLKTAVFEAAVSTNNSGFIDCSSLEVADFGSLGNLKYQEFRNCSKLTTLILRKSTAIVTLGNTNNFANAPFASGKDGGTIYIPKVLYDHLGDGTSLDYKAATNWETVDGYETITWAKIEGSQYEHYWGDGIGINQTITNTLTNCTNSNTNTAVPYGDTYTATLIANEGYTLSSVTVEMNGTNVTNTVYNNSSGEISIATVNGAITITATATANT